MAEKKRKVYEYYEIKNNTIERKLKTCPRCGPGVFMAEHKDRYTCGKCGYTEFKNEKSS